MFLGHFGLGFAAKKMNSRPSLGTYFMAVQFLDLVWPTLLLRGVEKVAIDPGNTAFTPLNFVHYPYSHSLVAAVFWGILFGLVYYLFKKDGRSSVLLGILVLSHWVLDFIAHRPDLPLSPWNDQKFGLGLWNSRPATIVIELILFIGGVVLYTIATKPKNKTSQFALWSFFAFMVTVYFANAINPPPHSTSIIALLGLSQWLLVAWGYWIDGTRVSTPSSKK
jgi:membrane-bound metal-dependent hydrolase YbcI (DUF457 family)